MATTQLPPDFKEFLKLLDAHEARYLVIGGYAVNAFGYIRNTLDIDLWIAGDAQNQSRVIDALRTFGFPSADPNLFAESDALVRMGVPPLRIEVMRTIAGVDFEPCWSRRVLIEDQDGFVIPMISLDDLKTNKRAAGRPKDLLDVAELP